MSNDWNSNNDVDEWAVQPEVHYENAQETPREFNAHSSHRRHPSSGQGRGRGRGRGDSRRSDSGGAWGSAHWDNQSKQESRSSAGWGIYHGSGGECALLHMNSCFKNLNSRKSADQTVGSDGYAVQEPDPADSLPKTKAVDVPQKDPSDEFYDNPNVKARDLRLENKLFGASQTSGINFDKYNSIAVE
ncbi:hypothetical protein HDU78_011175, partial [Chytriomyces hyalinus]